MAGSLPWIARQCRPDEAGTASNLQGSVARSNSERLVRCEAVKQREEVGIRIHPIPLNDIRTASVSDVALDLDRPDGSTQRGFLVRFTSRELHQNGTAPPSATAWSSLAEEVFMMSEGLRSPRPVSRVSGLVFFATCCTSVWEEPFSRLKIRTTTRRSGNEYKG